MEELAAKFADFVESIALKIRELTVDRVARGIRITGLGILVATLGFSTVLFLILTIFGALEIPLTTAGAYGVLAAILMGAGLYLWMKRA
ncbi:MAG: hypothetical protein OEM32_03425 [Acidimicrobiia bacterium]|nr:hypothetical protein [Acidimicrobiia bacterium]